MEKIPAQELIIKTLKEKSSLKQNIFQNTIKQFNELKSIIKEIITELKKEFGSYDGRVTIDYRERGEYEVELRIAGDVIIFYMHTNVFDFDDNHPIRKTSYIKENSLRSYCGMITVYNFLADSFKFNRTNDVGYMIARLFINNENHFFVEGKRQLTFLYNDFTNGVIDRATLKNIVESGILYVLNFDLFTPPFDAVKEISVSEIEAVANTMQIATGKRLGFRFQADSDQFE